MADALQTLEELQSGEYKGSTRLKLSTFEIRIFPSQILSLYATLTKLDLSSTSIATLPSSISRLHNLKILFCSSCNFRTFPVELSHCRSLEMVAFKSNHMNFIPENSFPRKLRWLILTDNEIEELPRSIGSCVNLQKCMLAGNRLRTLPEEMKECRKLGLLRVARNQVEEFPRWVLEMPELAFFSFAGNPCSSLSRNASSTSSSPGAARTNSTELEEIPWASLTPQQILGSGASGVISKGIWSRTHRSNDYSQTTRQDVEVAIKLFKGTITSDGSPLDELTACISAGAHPNLISPLGRITSHPEGKQGLVLRLIPPSYGVLGLPPTMQSCTRDVFADEMVLTIQTCKRILLDVANAAERLHARGVVHGDLYAHNILVDGKGHALLGDFGAATVFNGGSVVVGEMHDGLSVRKKLEKMEVLALGHLVEDLLGVVERRLVGFEGEDARGGDGEDMLSEKDACVIEGLNALHWRCTDPMVKQRPDFKEVSETLESF